MSERGSLTFVPSVHFSRTHRRRVRTTIEEMDPDIVAVELDERRFERLTQQTRLNSSELAQELPPATAAVYRTVKAIQQTVARLYGLNPGKTDMETAIETAANRGIDVALIDEPIDEIIATLSTRVGLDTIPKMMMRSQFLGPRERMGQLQLLFPAPSTRIDRGDDVQPAIDYLRRVLPEVTEVMIDQRDQAMAKRLHKLRCEGHDVVVVIGAGHHNGIKRTLEHFDAREVLPEVTLPIRSPTREVTEIPITE